MSSPRLALVRRREGRDQPDCGEAPGQRIVVIPDPQELMEREEGTEGRDGVIIQCLDERGQIRAERGSDQAEKPRPVARRNAVEDPRVKDQEDGKRYDIEERENGLKVENVSRPFHIFLGFLENSLNPDYSRIL